MISSSVDIYLQTIPQEDITERLISLMLQAESELSFYNELSYETSRQGMPVTTKQDNVVKLMAFINNVKTGAKYDLKNTGDWAKNVWFVFDGLAVRNDAPGNISYGYIGKVFGYDDWFLKAGAGAYQIKSETSSLSFGGSYFDDPYDTTMIQVGIDYYNKTH